MRKSKIVALYTVRGFPQINNEHVREMLVSRCADAVERVFSTYEQTVTETLDPRLQKKAQRHLSRIKRQALLKVQALAASYAVEVSGITPKGF
jgi:RNA-binding protein YlmH